MILEILIGILITPGILWVIQKIIDLVLIVYVISAALVLAGIWIVRDKITSTIESITEPFSKVVLFITKQN